jgi:hypothetical protein
MSNLAKVVDEFDLHDTKNGKIEVAILEEPYGEDSPSVVSIGVFLDKENSHPDWKVHVPKENIDSLIAALEKAKKVL